MSTDRPDPRLTARLEQLRPLPGVRAGSGLVAAGSWLYAVQDDAFAVARIDPTTGAVLHIPILGAGEALPKPEKPDFEAVVIDPAGRLLLVGSGSTPVRRALAWLDLVDHTATVAPAPALYDAVEAALGETPNVEGAVLAGDRLRLFHRAAGPTAASRVLTVPYRPGAGPEATVLDVSPLALGRAGHVPYHVTDAALMPDGRTMCLAAAEDTPNAYDDGPVVGAAVAVLEAGGVRWAPLLEADGSESVRKVEGLALDPDGQAGWVITDPDDAARPAELARLVLSGGW